MYNSRSSVLSATNGPRRRKLAIQLVPCALFLCFCACSGDQKVTDEEDMSDASTVLCRPLACEDDDALCGDVDDGCGGTINCEACPNCSADTDCPALPCRDLVGCEDSVCTYVPVQCDGRACGCPPGTTCSTEDLRRCGFDACAASQCDPSPTIDAEGNPSFGNVCVAPPPVNEPCGLCGLGYQSCGDGAVRACVDPALPTVDPEVAACPEVLDGVRGTSNTFVYLDLEAVVQEPSEADMGGSDMGGSDMGGSDMGDSDMGSDAGLEPPTRTPAGSPDDPVTDYASALRVAESRNASVIVVAGSGILNPVDQQGNYVPVQIINDISLLGGFDSVFAPDPAQRPRIVGTLNQADDEPSFVAVVAQNMTLPTALEHIAIETGDVPEDALADPTFSDPDYGSTPNNYGIWLDKSPGGLSLIDVEITVGAAGVVDSPEDGWSAAVFCTSDSSVVFLDEATSDSLSVPALAGPQGHIAGQVVKCRQEER